MRARKIERIDQRGFARRFDEKSRGPAELERRERGERDVLACDELHRSTIAAVSSRAVANAHWLIKSEPSVYSFERFR
jgi:hypothetical protein